jgi:hypothetical protein
MTVWLWDSLHRLQSHVDSNLHFSQIPKKFWNVEENIGQSVEWTLGCHAL